MFDLFEMYLILFFTTFFTVMMYFYLQDPADGNYRVRPDNLLEGDQPVDLIGTIMPCDCHYHSFMCDHETGVCHVGDTLKII